MLEKHKILSGLGAIAVFVGGVVLAVLQIRWIDTSADAEEEQIRRNLTVGSGQALRDSGDEIRVLIL